MSDAGSRGSVLRVRSIPKLLTWALVVLAVVAVYVAFGAWFGTLF